MSIIDWIVSIYNEVKDMDLWLSTIVDFLDPESDEFILKVAFVPTKTDRTNELIDELSNKFLGLNDLVASIDSLKTYSNTNEPPVFQIKFTGTGPYPTGTYNVIDFQFYAQYREWIHTFTLMTCWFYFLKKLINYLPNIVY